MIKMRFKCRVNISDQVMRQAQYTYEFVQTSRSFNVRKKPIASSTPKKNRLQKKR